MALNPGDSDAQYILGRNLQDLGRQKDAIDHWRLALQANPDNTRALYSLAQVFSKEGDPDAKFYMDRFQDLQRRQLLTDRIQTLGNFGLEAANAHNWTQAISDIQQALKLCGNCPQGETLHKNLGLIYSRKGDISNAERELRAALRLNPEDSDALKAMEILQSMPRKPPDVN